MAVIAPVAQSFNNRVLVCWGLGIGGVCALAVALRHRWLWGVLIIVAITVQQAGYPHSLGYSMRFKQFGQTSKGFQFLEKQGFSPNDSVAIHSADESSFFLACVNDYLLPRTGRMFYIETLGDVGGLDVESLRSDTSHVSRSTSYNPDWLIVCTKDAFDFEDQVKGRRYRISWDFIEGRQIPDGYKEVFQDNFYQIDPAPCARLRFRASTNTENWFRSIDKITFNYRAGKTTWA